MHPHESTEQSHQVNGKRILLVGNPNVGKSVIFHHLSGRYIDVSNYPGTTVEVSSGVANFLEESDLQQHRHRRWRHGQRRIPPSNRWTIIDTPGINSLTPRSEDERITRDIILNDNNKIILQVGDAKNLRRTLVLSTQLAETGLPQILDLNMWDEAESVGLELDTSKLSSILGIPVITTVAVQGKGLKSLKETFSPMLRPAHAIEYDPAVEEAIGKIEQLLSPLEACKRAIAVMLIARDDTLKPLLTTQLEQEKLADIDKIVADLQSKYPEPLSFVISKQRAAAVEGILSEVIVAGKRRTPSPAEHLGRLAMHPVAGIPILLAILFLIYELVGEFGAGVAVDFIESIIFGEYINPLAISLFSLLPIRLARELFVGQYGLITMGLTYALAVVLPIMTLFFLAFGILEDSGYLPRLAIMANRLFKVVGLNGKAVLPMVLGFGCDTMATLTTRILDTKRDRVIATLLLALGIPCSAQVGVILAMLSSLSATAVLLFTLVISSQLLLVGFLAARLIPGEKSDFIVEIPPLRVPQLSNVAFKTFYRVEWFLKEAVPLFLIGTVFLFIAKEIGLLNLLEQLGSPIVEGFLGLPAKATQSFILGFLRRDYGAAGLFQMTNSGLLDNGQALVSIVVITLFVPCIANFFVIIKERGLKTALAIVGFIFPFAILVGGALNLILRILGVTV